MGSLCILPLSSKESVFHFICSITGSAVCLDCFAWVALVDSLLCTCSLGVVPVEFVGGELVAVSRVKVSSLCKYFFKMVECKVKACGCLIFGNLTYPIAFAYVSTKCD